MLGIAPLSGTPLSSLAGAAYAVSVTESSAAVIAVGTVAEYASSYADSGAASTALPTLAAMQISHAETSLASAAQGTLASLALSHAESASALDTAETNTAYLILHQEAVGAQDVFMAWRAFLVTMNESAAAYDSLTPSNGVTVSVSESAAGLAIDATSVHSVAAQVVETAVADNTLSLNAAFLSVVDTVASATALTSVQSDLTTVILDGAVGSSVTRALGALRVSTSNLVHASDVLAGRKLWELVSTNITPAE